MTVSSETNKVSYAGNGSTTDFSTGFVFLDDDHVLVTLVDTSGTETTQTITTEYTLTGAGSGSAGTVTMLTAPASGETLIISRDVPLTQGSDYVANDPFPAETHEEALDKLTMIDQQQQEELDRSLRFPLSVDSGVSNEIPTPTANYYLRFNSAGDAIEAVGLAGDAGEVNYENLNANGDIGFSAGQVPDGGDLGSAAQVDVGVTAGDVVQVNQTLNATTRAATTTLGTSLNHTLSDTSANVSAFNGVAGVTYHCRALGAGNLTHHATDLIITQTGADITTAAGDTFDVEMITGTTCRIKNYQRADGTALVSSSVTFASSAENAAGTIEDKAVDPLGIREAFNATGSAPVYACRAWVNFDGTGTVAINASGNVSSITDNGVGDYTVNFTTALPDTDYAVLAMAGGSNSGNQPIGVYESGSTARTASLVRLYFSQAGGSAIDTSSISVGIIR